MDRIKYVYNRIMHFAYRAIPVSKINILELFPKTADKSFHAVVAMRYIFVEYDSSQKDSADDREKIKLYRKTLCLSDAEQEKDIAGFHELIERIRRTGFDKKHPILMDKDKNVIDGTHRLAAAIFLGMSSVYVRIIPRHLKPMTIAQRVEMLHLSDEEETELYAAYKRLYERVLRNASR